MNSPATARNGNLVSAGGMTLAIGATAVLILTEQLTGDGISAIAWGSSSSASPSAAASGLYTARTVKMTAMPQLVSLFNAVGGGAAALIAIDDYLRPRRLGDRPHRHQHLHRPRHHHRLDHLHRIDHRVGQAAGPDPRAADQIPGGQLVTVALARHRGRGADPVRRPARRTSPLDAGLILAAALIFGVTMTLPIGGADMPVVISLLNSFTGTAVAMAGFVLDNPVLIIAGALVGASGAILTKLMADAMNRSVMNIMIGGFGGGDDDRGAAAGAGGSVREIGADDVAIQLAYAQLGDHRARATASPSPRPSTPSASWPSCSSEGASTSSTPSIPVAGRMPGHMNVLLAEANVPYPQLKEMDDINPEFDRCDVALVIGANDVTNPAARRPGSPVSGMPILDVDHAKSIVVIKRSMGRGYAGIDNELYTDREDRDAVRRREGRPGRADRGGQGALGGVRRSAPPRRSSGGVGGVVHLRAAPASRATRPRPRRRRAAPGGSRTPD